MKYLITGGCGFIGSHLTDILLEKNHSVEILDDLSTGTIENIKGYLDSPRFSLWIDTILNYPLLTTLVQNSDFIFHLAAGVGVKTVMENPLSTLETNVEGTRNVLALATRYHKPVLLASTSEVYGKNIHIPFSEEADIVLGPTTKKRWGYACSKALDEFLALAYRETHGLNVIIARLFNTVGPRQRETYGMVIPRFITQALQNRPITVFGDGSQTRCFIHCKDVVAALIALTEKKEAMGEIFNIGSHEEISIKKLAQLIIRLTESDSPIEYISPTTLYAKGFEDMQKRVPDTTKIEKLIGFSPHYTIERIIKETIAYFQTQ
ncbi:MAG: GDP-mannose 4,6-dehydratase [Candidatus Ratteibacteria bacterium]